MFADRLTYFRQKRGLTQQKLADMVHVSVSGVQKWERGQAEPNTRILRRMADIFDVTLDELCDRVPPETNAAIMMRAFCRLSEEEQKKLIAMGKVMFGHAFETESQGKGR